MKDLIQKALDAISAWISTLLDTIVLAIGEKLAPCVMDCADMGITIYNGIIGSAIDMLTTNPMSWNTEAWNFIATEVYPVFLLVACPLVAIFWLFRLSAESMDPKMHGDVRMDTMLFGIIHFSIAEFVTVYALWIVCALFSFVDLLTGGWVGNNANISSDLGFETAEVAALPLLTLFITLLISFIYLGVLFVVSCVIAYIATIRFFKILAMIPFGTLASSTIAGTREVSNTALHFWKYILSVVLEAVVMLLILALFSKVQGSLEIIKPSKLPEDYKIIGILLNRILIAFLCLGGIKSAGSMLQRAGLGS